MEVSYLVQAGSLIHTRARHALVDVQLAARPHVTPLALTLEGTLGVYTLPCVLTRVGTCFKKIITVSLLYQAIMYGLNKEQFDC